jgi:hypothetical protein
VLGNTERVENLGSFRLRIEMGRFFQQTGFNPGNLGDEVRWIIFNRFGDGVKPLVQWPMNSLS